MANVLLTWELGEGSGHCANLEPIARGLVERGHTITFVACELAAARSVFDGIDVTFVQAPPIVESPSYAVPRTMSYPEILHNIGFGDENDLERQLRKWWDIFEQTEPDIVICEHSPTALVASRWIDCRRVLVGTGFTTPPDVAPHPVLQAGDNDVLSRALLHESKVLQRINYLLEKDGLEPLKRVSQIFSDADENFLLSFRELDHYPQRPQAEYFGAWSPRRYAAPLWPLGNGLRVFCYLHPTISFQYVRPLLSALCTAGLRVLAHVPGHDPHLKSLKFPNLYITNKPVDINQVTSECGFAVTNGSAGITTHLLLKGIPLLSVPMQIEQQMLGNAVERLGAGRMAFGFDPHGVVSAITAMITNPAYRKGAQAFAEKYADFDPVASAERIVDRIEALL